MLYALRTRDVLRALSTRGDYRAPISSLLTTARPFLSDLKPFCRSPETYLLRSLSTTAPAHTGPIARGNACRTEDQLQVGETAAAHVPGLATARCAVVPPIPKPCKLPLQHCRLESTR